MPVRTAFAIALWALGALTATTAIADGHSGPATDPAADPIADLYPGRTEGLPPSINNISTFVYRDRNRNGLYDLGDYPMTKVITAMAQDGEGRELVESNLNGYANFSTSADPEKEPLIGTPGTYEFTVLPPPDWDVTSGNQTQTIEFVDAPGWMLGLRPASSLVPVGLAQRPLILGINGAGDVARVELVQGDTILGGRDVAAGAAFGFQVAPGDYVLRSGAAERPVTFRSDPVVVGTVTQTRRPTRPETVITFDDIFDHDLLKVPNGYGGLNWTDLNAIHRDMVIGQGYANGVTSGEHTAYSTNLRPGQFWSERPFDLYGFDITIAWQEAEGEFATIDIYRGEELVRSDRLSLSIFGPVTYQPNIGGVTRVSITTERGWQAVIDDVRVGLPE